MTRKMKMDRLSDGSGEEERTRVPLMSDWWYPRVAQALVGKTGRANGEKRMDCRLGVGKRAHIPDANY